MLPVLVAAALVALVTAMVVAKIRTREQERAHLEERTRVDCGEH